MVLKTRACLWVWFIPFVNLSPSPAALSLRRIRFPLLGVTEYPQTHRSCIRLNNCPVLVSGPGTRYLSIPLPRFSFFCIKFFCPESKQPSFDIFSGFRVRDPPPFGCPVRVGPGRYQQSAPPLLDDGPEKAPLSSRDASCCRVQVAAGVHLASRAFVLQAPAQQFPPPTFSITSRSCPVLHCLFSPLWLALGLLAVTFRPKSPLQPFFSGTGVVFAQFADFLRMGRPERSFLLGRAPSSFFFLGSASTPPRVERLQLPEHSPAAIQTSLPLLFVVD